LLANGTTLLYNGAAASSDRSFTINGTADGDSASLNASGSGAIVLSNTSTPAYGMSDQKRTLILTGTSTYTNTLAANLANNGTAPLSVTKTGTGTWVLTGNNNYTGTNLLSGGMLSVGAATNLGASSAPLVFNGGGIQITGTSITNLSGLGRTVIFNPGVTVTIDIADAGNTFTVDQAIPDGVTIVKVGAGNLLFNPPYAGAITITSGATLQYNDDAVISTRPLLNNGTLIVNRSGTDTQGTTFHSIMGGTGALTKSNTGTLVLNNINTYTGSTKASAGTITLSHPLAIMNSAVDTTGAGTISLSSVTTPTFGGLTGTVAVATALTGYGSVTELNLNPQSGITYSYSGVIANGASGMALKLVGPGTQILTGTNTYTGITYLNAGSLAVGSGSTIGKITGTTGLTFNGGTLQFNRSGTTDVDAFPNTAPITVNRSSTFGVTSADAGNANANETVGAVTLNAGQMNFNWSNGGSSGTQIILTSLARSGTASANFNSGFASNNSRWKITGSGTTTAGQIIGPWCTTGGNNAGFNSTDYAVFSSDFVAQAALTSNNTETTWGSAENINLSATATTLTATRTLNTLRYSAAAGSLALGVNSLETYGLLNGGSGLLTVSGTGALTTPTGGGNLYVNAGANSITVNAPINDNGAAVTLVKNGGSTLTLGVTNSTFSGGIFLNAGTLQLPTGSTATSLGNSTNVVTFTGNSTLSIPQVTLTLSQGFAVNEGVTATFTGPEPSGINFNGALTGAGTVRVRGNGSFTADFKSTNNTFSGDITTGTGTAGYSPTVTMNSLADTAPGGRLALSETTSGGTFNYGTGAVVPLVFNNRRIELSGTTAGGTINNNSAQAFTINSDLLVTVVGNKTLTLGGTGAGTNTFAGKITDGPGAVISLTKGGACTWILSGTNTYTGTTTVNAGKLVLSNAWSVASGKLDVKSGAKVQLDYTGVRPVSEFWTNNVKAASGIIYNSVNATNYLFGSGSIMVGIETFSVTYNGNGNTGGSVPVDANAYTNNAIVTVLGAGTLTKGDFSFGGWSVPAGPTYAPGNTFQITTNTTLYAVWRPAGTVIHFR
jgi:autotransporter-associated beta strand protein